MRDTDLLFLAVDRALRDTEQLTALGRADLFQAIGMILDLATDRAEDAHDPALAARIRQQAEQAREVAFQLRESEQSQLTFLQKMQARQPSANKEDGQIP